MYVGHAHQLSGSTNKLKLAIMVVMWIVQEQFRVPKLGRQWSILAKTLGSRYLLYTTLTTIAYSVYERSPCSMPGNILFQGKAISKNVFPRELAEILEAERSNLEP